MSSNGQTCDENEVDWANWIAPQEFLEHATEQDAQAARQPAAEILTDLRQDFLRLYLRIPTAHADWISSESLGLMNEVIGILGSAGKRPIDSDQLRIDLLQILKNDDLASHIRPPRDTTAGRVRNELIKVCTESLRYLRYAGIGAERSNNSSKIR